MVEASLQRGSSAKGFLISPPRSLQLAKTLTASGRSGLKTTNLVKSLDREGFG
jgi:hypothetical protein